MENLLNNAEFSKIGIVGLLAIIVSWALVKEFRCIIFGFMDRLEKRRQQKADPEYDTRERSGVKEVHEAILKFLSVSKDVTELKSGQQNILGLFKKIEGTLERIDLSLRESDRRISFLEGKIGGI